MEINDNLKKAWKETKKIEFMEVLKGSHDENLSELLWSEKYKKNWESAFDQAKTKNKVLICADERVLPKEGEFKVGTAGQLILESKEYQDDFVVSFRGEIKTVRSHSGCGAAAVAYSRLSEEEKQRCLSATNELTARGLKINEVSQGDLYGIYHSYNLAQKLGAAFEHTPFSIMRGYKDFHDARIIFWSSNENFDPSNLTGKFLPPHFLANGLAFGLTNDYCKEELKLLSGIALGEHGFYNLFNADNPFYVISVGGNTGDAKRLNGTARETLKEFGER
ncbi:MAG: hypothetical protein AB1472_07665, partial [Candidatus Omnitrophota bacterium]